jgi:hypothetical protein
MRICEPHDTGRALAFSGQPLGVAGGRCSRRVLLSARQLEAHENDRRALRRLPLLCRRCGSRDVELYLIETPDDAPAFVAGDTPEMSEGQGD